MSDTPGSEGGSLDLPKLKPPQWQDARIGHPASVIRTCASVVVTVTGLATMLFSVFPFAQAAGDPGQANYAGSVSAERSMFLRLGLALAVLGLLVVVTRQRWWFVVSILAALAIGLVAVRTINEVADVVRDTSELTSDVGWALYALCACSALGIVLSIIGLVSVRAHRD